MQKVQLLILQKNYIFVFKIQQQPVLIFSFLSLLTVLHGTVSVTDPTMSSTSSLFDSTFTTVLNTTDSTPESVTYSPSPVTTVSFEDSSTETSPTSSPDSGSSGGTQEGLTAAEAAGVAVGTFAGVAALSKQPEQIDWYLHGVMNGLMDGWITVSYERIDDQETTYHICLSVGGGIYAGLKFSGKLGQSLTFTLLIIHHILHHLERG